MTIKPDFFIVGAPKSGTTALHEYLIDHPLICMSSCKEPHYFADDFGEGKYRSVVTEEEYLNLFQHCKKDCMAIGESSVGYLYSSVAINNIYKFSARSRIIVMLRNPVDLAYSLHAQNIYNYIENEVDFEKAWYLQYERMQGKSIPLTCHNPELLIYKEIASLGKQLQNLYDIFPAQQIKCIFFDDFIGDTQSSYKEILDFLDVPYDNRTDFPAINESKKHKFRWIARLTDAPPRPLRFLAIFIRRKLGFNFHGLLSWLRALNGSSYKRPPLEIEFRNELMDEFREDLKILEKITQRDLARWVKKVNI